MIKHIEISDPAMGTLKWEMPESISSKLQASNASDGRNLHILQTVMANRLAPAVANLMIDLLSNEFKAQDLSRARYDPEDVDCTAQ